MASAAMDLFVGRVVSVLENEASLLRGVHDEIKLELLSMGSFLKDAEKKKELTEGEKSWVAQVRGIAYDVEDIIDEFAYHINSQQVGGQFNRILHKTIFFPKHLWVRHQVAKKLQKINRTIRAISQRSQRYGVECVEGTGSSQNDGIWQRNFGESSIFTKEDDFVGIEDEKKLLMGWLMDEEPHLTIVSMVGMGGSGKTTLAAKIFTNDTVKQHFGCYAWITVSQTCVADDLLKNLIKEIYAETQDEVPSGLNTMAYKDLLNQLVNYLETRRYLIVLDDVWDVKLLMEIMVVFRDSLLGSRIIVTTRKEDVSSFCHRVRSYCHRIQPLSQTESWDLFIMKAFSCLRNKSCPPEIELLAGELVARCEGLPLAIVAFGGLMSSKRSADEWSSVLKRLNLQLSSNPELEVVTKRILLLSFNDLPYQLKHCFLCCSIFPEDYSIKRKRHIRLWLAEGFVEKVNRVRPEEVADGYLLELVSRSLLQVVTRNRTGRPKTCKMHDILRELALSTSERENFFNLYDGKQAIEDCKAYRISIQTVDKELKSYRGMSQLRSLLVFVKDLPIGSFPDMLPSGLKLLRVLDLDNMPIDTLPRELPYLFNLRYLNLNGTPIKELPKSIGSLRNLESLYIMETKIEKLPSEITKCKNLLYLVMYRYTGSYGSFLYFSGTQVPSNISKLKKLRVLVSIEIDGDTLKQIGDMTQLIRLSMTNVKEEDEKNLCASIQKLKLLHNLGVVVTDEQKLL